MVSKQTKDTVRYVLSIFLISYLVYLMARLVYWTCVYKPKSSSFQESAKVNDFSKSTHNNHVPKVLWAYWDSDNIPSIVQKCIDGWKQYNPDWKVVVLNKKNLKQYVSIADRYVNHPLFNDSHARFTDLVRLCALAEHGGVWIDASIILTERLEKWLFAKEAEFVGFYLESFTTMSSSPVIESWFLVSQKDSMFMRLWRDEFLSISMFDSVKQYTDSRRRMGVNYQKISDPEYLAIHVSAQKVLQIDRYPLDRLLLYKAEDGPYKYLKDTNWESILGIFEASRYSSLSYPLLKMRGLERGLYTEKFRMGLRGILTTLPNLDNLVYFSLLHENDLFKK